MHNSSPSPLCPPGWVCSFVVTADSEEASFPGARPGLFICSPASDRTQSAPPPAPARPAWPPGTWSARGGRALPDTGDLDRSCGLLTSPPPAPGRLPNTRCQLLSAPQLPPQGADGHQVPIVGWGWLPARGQRADELLWPDTPVSRSPHLFPRCASPAGCLPRSQGGGLL